MDFLINILFPSKWKESHIAGALYRLSELSLVLGASTRMLRVHYLRLSRSEPPGHLGILIVDILEILRAEETLSVDCFIHHFFI